MFSRMKSQLNHFTGLSIPTPSILQYWKVMFIGTCTISHFMRATSYVHYIAMGLVHLSELLSDC